MSDAATTAGTGAMTDTGPTISIQAGLAWVEAEWARSPSGNGAEAADGVLAALAAELGSVDPAVRRAAVASDWPPRATARLLAIMDSGPRAALAADLATEGDLLGTLVEGLALPADDPASLLAPDSVASVLIDAVAGLPDASTYADRIGAATATLSDLPAALFGAAVPSAISRTAAVLHDGVGSRFGPEEAAALTRGVLLLRLVGPVLTSEPAAALARLLATAPDAAEATVDEALTEFAAEVVLAGRAASEAVDEGEDADDLVVQRGAALASEAALAATFRAPTPDDRLGTLPTVRVTALGQAIMAARAQRPVSDIEWQAVAVMQEEEPAGLDAVLMDERCEVLDLIVIG